MFGPIAPVATRFAGAIRSRVGRAAVRLGWGGEAIVAAACHPVAPALISAALRVQADLYVAHYPAALPAAAIAARRSGGVYAFDAEDFHLGEFEDGPGASLRRDVLMHLEGRYLAGCAYVTAASPGIADAYAATYGIQRPTVVLNVFPKSTAPNKPSAKGVATPGPSVYWFSQTIGPGRGLEGAVRAISMATSRPHLYLRGTPTAHFEERLCRLAAELGVEAQLHLLPPAPPSQLQHLAATYDVGLSAEPGFTKNNRIALGNKLFSFLLAGVPIVASAIPSHCDLAVECKGAVHLYAPDDSSAMARALDGILTNETALSRARESAFIKGQTRFNWEVERTRVINVVSVSLCP
jgi:glycosyltransferase involved in cell wall biosynthesis